MSIDVESDVAVVHCDGIMCGEKVELSLPAGWTGVIEFGGDGRSVFCSKSTCQLQSKWFDSQCRGCVGSYSDCALGRSFLYAEASRRTITSEQIEVIRGGRCPVRTGGMIMTEMSARGFQVEAGSNVMPACDVAGAGDAVADSIEAYITKYPTVVG